MWSHLGHWLAMCLTLGEAQPPCGENRDHGDLRAVSGGNETTCEATQWLANHITEAGLQKGGPLRHALAPTQWRWSGGADAARGPPAGSGHSAKGDEIRSRESAGRQTGRQAMLVGVG